MNDDGNTTQDPAAPDKAWSPRQQAARARILAAARGLYFRDGFEKVTSDAVVAEAAVSKATLYKHFPSMNALFRAVVSAEVDRFGYDPQLSFGDVESFATALSNYATNLLSFLNSMDAVSLSRLMLEEARHQPDATATYFDTAYGQTLQQLATLFEGAAERGFIVLHRPASETAEAFLGALEGFGLLRAQLGIAKTPYPHPHDTARSTVDDFLRAHAPEGGSAS